MPVSYSHKSSTKRGRGRPKLEDVEDIEKTLLDAALEEFLQHGYGGASISRIVRSARMSKTTVYSRFASKEALFHAIMQRQIAQLEPASALASESGRLDIERGLKAYANYMLEQSLKREFFGVNRLMYSESHRFPELAAEAVNRTRLGIQRISAFIRDCADADGLACKDPESVAEIFILMIRGWYIDVMLDNRKVTARQRRDWVDKSVGVLLASRDQW